MKAQSFDDLYKEAEAHDDYWIAGTVQELTEEIFVLMEREGITRSELARRLGTSPAYVTKILRGNANFTVATMVRLARALEADLRIQLKPSEASQQSKKPRGAAKRNAGARHSADLTAAVPAAAPLAR